MLDWRTVTSSHEPKFMVRGTELSVAIVPGFLSRFQICEIRSYVFCESTQRNECDRIYAIRDAETVSDGQVREGIRPAITGRYETIDAALAAIEQHRPAIIA